MKKVIIISLVVIIFGGLLTWVLVDDYNNRKGTTVFSSDLPGVDVELNDFNYFDTVALMKSDHDRFIGKIIVYEGLVQYADEDICIVGRKIRDHQNKQDIVYGMECRFKDGAKFENGTWLRITGVLDEDTEDLTGKTFIYCIVGYGDYEVIEPGTEIIGEIN